MTKSVIDVGRMEELSQLWGQYLGQFTEDFCNFYNSLKGDDINIPLQKDEDWSLTGTRIEREVTEQEKQEMKEQLLAKFGRFDDQVALSILESCDYVWSAVVFHAEELLAEQAAIGLASDEDADKVDHPTFDRICNERPNESRKLIALAVRKTLFNYEHALVYLDNPKMRDVLDAELQQREAERLKKTMPKKDIIIGTPRSSIPVPDLWSLGSASTGERPMSRLFSQSPIRYAELIHRSTEVTPAELRAIMSDPKSLYERVVILDARSDCEFNGGHITGAINVSTQDDLRTIFERYRAVGENVLVVFHGEYSRRRGPTLLHAFRDYDHRVNVSSYPYVCYPMICLLEGGYRQFYAENPDLCVGGYVPRRDPVRHWKTKTVDLHGFSKRDALLEVQQTLTDVVRSRGFDKINFITGQGKHSKGEAVLKPAVLFYLQNMGCQRRIHPRNPGIVEAFPFGDMY